MNAIILTAVWGVVMMLVGAFVKDQRLPKYIAMAGLAIILAANCMELHDGAPFKYFQFDVKDMLHTYSRSLIFLTVVLFCTLLYFMLN